MIAAGTKAAVPPIPGLADVPYWTNREALKTEAVPDSLIVLGGGAIGSELAQVFRRFGSAVTLVEAAPRLTVAEEPEASAVLQDAFEGEGITVHTGVGATNVSATDGADGISVILADGTSLQASVLLVATGRTIELAKFNSSALGVDPAKSRSLPTNDFMEVVDYAGSHVSGVYAVGDVAGKGAFTHVAVTQGRMVADQILGRPSARWSSRSVGHVTFTDPEIGSVGLTEAQARDAGVNVAPVAYSGPRRIRTVISAIDDLEGPKRLALADRLRSALCRLGSCLMRRRRRMGVLMVSHRDRIWSGFSSSMMLTGI